MTAIIADHLLTNTFIVEFTSSLFFAVMLGATLLGPS